MYIIDTDWFLQALAGHEPALNTIVRLSATRVFISIVSVGEIYERAFVFANAEAHLDSFRVVLARHPVINLNDPIMERFAELRAFLRRRGQMISDFDILIASSALYHDLTVLTFNRRHFDRIPDLKLYQPT